MASNTLGQGCRRQSRQRLQRTPYRTSYTSALVVGVANHRENSRFSCSTAANNEDHRPVSYEVEHALGRIIIRNMREDDINGAAVLLSRSFAGREWKSLEDVRSYLRTACVLFPDSVLLVATLFNVQENDTDAAPKNRGRLLALADVALSDLLLQSVVPKQYAAIPEESAYLSNMCVDPNFRGCGVGKCMLQACDRAVKDLGQFHRISLHVDADIAAFYQTNGYEEVRRGGVLSMFQSGPAVMSKLIQ